MRVNGGLDIIKNTVKHLKKNLTVFSGFFTDIKNQIKYSMVSSEVIFVSLLNTRTASRSSKGPKA